jgi:hypothetical protein
MLSKLIAGAAVVGSLTAGTVGLAGAATPAPSGNSGGTQLATACAKLPQVQSLVTQWQSDLKGFLPQVQALESQAKTDGLTRVATAIGNTVSRVQDRQSRLNARLSKLEAKCQANGSSTSNS